MSSKTNRTPRRGEDFLAGVAAIALTLENGEKVRFNIARETAIPSDDTLLRTAKRAAARLAFWAYQTERALARVREHERVLAQVEGRAYQYFRIYYTDHEGVDVTEAMLRAAIDQDPKVRAARISLNVRRNEHGLLRAVREAVDHRAWMVRALLTRREL